jgi:hypothetical protein
MKKFYLISLVLSVSCAVFAAQDTYNLSQHASVFPAYSVASNGVAVTSSSVSVLPYSGTGTLCVDLGAATSTGHVARVTIINLQKTTTNASTWGTLYSITNTGATAVFYRRAIELNKGGALVRASVTSTNGISPVSVILNAN